MKQIRYAIEALLLYILLGFFKLLPPPTASNIGGYIGRAIGPRLAASRKAMRNIERALPEKTPQERHIIVTQMWEHLGRVIAEYPHLETIARDYTDIENREYLQHLAKTKQNAICFAGHLGGWEVNGPAVHIQENQPFDLSYRAPNNPWVDRLLAKMRSIRGGIPAHPKSREGGAAMMRAVKNGRSLGILIDQKYNQGLAVPFFGMPAMTNPFFVQIAQKYNCPLVPVRNIRLDGCRFRLSFFEPLELFTPTGQPRPVEHVIKDAHAYLEEWIRQEPGQWLWLHRRWPD